MLSAIFSRLATDYMVTYNDNVYTVHASYWNPVAFFVWAFFILLMIAGMWQVLKKAGRPGWAVLIPIYNALQLIWLNKKPWWWILLLCIPFVNVVVLIMLYYSTAQAFGKGIGYTLLLIFLPFIGWLMLGFGDAKYMLAKSSRGRRR